MSWITDILGSGGPASDTGQWPDLLKTVLAGNADQPMSETVPTGGTSAMPSLPSAASPAGAVASTGNPIIDAILKPYQAPKRKPLDYLLMAASPFVAGAANALMAPPSRRNASFWGNALGSGFGILANEATRKEREAELARQRMIENILLKQKIRGTPIGGVNPDTGKGVEMYPGTGEVIPGIGPQPRIPRNVQTRERQLPDGSTIQEQYDEGSGVWRPSQIEETPSGQGGKTRVPFTNPPKKQKAPRELKVGSDVPGAAKNDEQYYWVSPGEKPQPSGLYRSAADRPTREGDINRAQKKEVNDAALTFLEGAHSQLGPGKKPEDYVNAAVDLYQRAAKSKKELRGYATDITNGIRTIGRSVKTDDEFAKLIEVMSGLQQPQGKQ